MCGTPDVVQPPVPRDARDKRGVPLARERRGWREVPRMCRSRRAGIRRWAPIGSALCQRPGCRAVMSDWSGVVSGRWRADS